MSLIFGNLPQTEPTLRIGIILPVDQRKVVKISFTDSSLYEIETDTQLKLSHKTPNKLDFSVDDGDVIIRKSVNKFDEQGIIIHRVPAGRGFHWEKTIDITLPGNVLITNRNGFLLVVNKVPLEQYLACVAVSEMSGTCPSALLEGQTITARSWILAAAEQKHSELDIDACNDDCCQRYQGLLQMTETSKRATDNSRGIVLLYNHKICDARYSKSCGGVTEHAEHVWNMPPTPYLTSIYDGPKTDKEVDWNNWFFGEPKTFCSPAYINEKDLYKYLGNVDKDGQYFRWQVRFSQKEFCEFFSRNVNEDVALITKIDALNRGQSGRINHLYLDYQTIEGKSKTFHIKNEYEIRRILHPSFLYSSCFVIRMDDKHIEFNGAGWGHGVGLCQIGALGMALNGFSTEEILKHYFRNSTLKKLF